MKLQPIKKLVYIFKKNRFTLFFAFIGTLMTICFCDFTILRNSENKIYFSTNTIPHNEVGVVLGASKVLANGSINPYFANRVLATVQLYKAHKIDFILVSGENSTITYNEPQDFKEELLKAGIPENKIYLDYAGFRTLDSIIRAKEIFGLTQFTIISQNFHIERALYIAQKNNIEAIAYSAKDAEKKYHFFQSAREYLARTKVFIDIAFNKQPKFLGSKINLK